MFMTNLNELEELTLNQMKIILKNISLKKWKDFQWLKINQKIRRTL